MCLIATRVAALEYTPRFEAYGYKAEDTTYYLLTTTHYSRFESYGYKVEEDTGTTLYRIIICGGDCYYGWDSPTYDYNVPSCVQLEQALRDIIDSMLGVKGGIDTADDADMLPAAAWLSRTGFGGSYFLGRDLMLADDGATNPDGSKDGRFVSAAVGTRSGLMSWGRDFTSLLRSTPYVRVPVRDAATLSSRTITSSATGMAISWFSPVCVDDPRYCASPQLDMEITNECDDTAATPTCTHSNPCRSTAAGDAMGDLDCGSGYVVRAECQAGGEDPAAGSYPGFCLVRSDLSVQLIDEPTVAANALLEDDPLDGQVDGLSGQTAGVQRVPSLEKRVPPTGDGPCRPWEGSNAEVVRYGCMTFQAPAMREGVQLPRAVKLRVSLTQRQAVSP